MSRPLGLPRARRLRRSVEFQSATRRGAKLRDSLFVVNALRVDGSARLGISVSRRVSLKAVVRNRIKRQIRESFRLHQQQLRGLIVFVVAQPASATATKVQLARALNRLWTLVVDRA